MKCTSDDDCPSNEPDCLKTLGVEPFCGKKCRSDADCTAGMPMRCMRKSPDDEGVCSLWLKKTERKKSKKSNKKSSGV